MAADLSVFVAGRQYSGNSSCKHQRPSWPRCSGYTQDHVARLVAEAGGTWTRYAAGDHTR
ncbi:MAG TPA: hypothetical protein VK784_05865 [Pseudonocardiaceae bacterium]|jgi:hypothetical protein|nr:hypothetical protein [Pseudonocardiaceae bacterium]